MLYDQRKAGIYSVENFAAWLAKQPAGKVYDYGDPRQCAAAQYLQAHGISEWNSMMTPRELHDLGWHEIAFARVHDTFGAAAKRAHRQLNGTLWERITKRVRGAFGLC